MWIHKKPLNLPRLKRPYDNSGSWSEPRIVLVLEHAGDQSVGVWLTEPVRYDWTRRFGYITSVKHITVPEVKLRLDL